MNFHVTNDCFLVFWWKFCFLSSKTQFKVQLARFLNQKNPEKLATGCFYRLHLTTDSTDFHDFVFFGLVIISSLQIYIVLYTLEQIRRLQRWSKSKFLLNCTTREGVEKSTFFKFRFLAGFWFVSSKLSLKWWKNIIWMNSIEFLSNDLKYEKFEISTLTPLRSKW